jgi:hypothetical protein
MAETVRPTFRLRTLMIAVTMVALVASVGQLAWSRAHPRCKDGPVSSYQHSWGEGHNTPNIYYSCRKCGLTVAEPSLIPYRGRLEIARHHR